MSLNLLMVSGSGGIPDPPGEGSNPDPQWLDGWPDTDDAILRSLRPTGLEPVVVVTGAPGDSVGDLLTPMATEISENLFTPYGAEGPRDHGVLFLPPGTYVGGFGTGNWLSIVGTTGNPEDVIIFSDTEDADGVVHPFGPLHMEGVTLKAGFSESLQKSPKYCAHISGGFRTTFANVIFDASDARTGAFGSAGTVGCDGNVGSIVTFYKCSFIRPDDLAGTENSAMNVHGGPAGVLPMSVAFIDCDMPNGGGFGGGGTIDGGHDKLYVIGSNVGTPGIGTSETTDVWTDSDATVFNPASGGTVGTVTRNWTEWPTPAPQSDAGLVPIWDSYFSPQILDTLDTTVERAVVTDAAPMTPVTGRTYYAPVPIRKGMWLNRYGLQVHAGAGAPVTLTPEPDPGIYYGAIERKNEPEFLDLGDASVRPLGIGQWLIGYFYSWILYPGTEVTNRNRLWVKFRFDDATGVSISGSTELPGLHKCYYSDDDGATLVEAPAGTPFPLAHAAQWRGGPLPENPDPPIGPTYTSVYGDTPPPGTHTLYTDNGEPITLAQTFRRSTGSPIPDNANIVGGRVYLPSAAPGSTAVKIMLWEGSLDLATAPDREVTVPLNSSTGWVEGIFDTPFPIPGIFTPYRIGYTFVGNPATYIYAPNFRAGAVAVSPQANGIEVTEGFSSYRSGSSAQGNANSIDVGYGVDILID